MELTPLFINPSDFNELMSSRIFSPSDHDMVVLTDLATYGTYAYEHNYGFEHTDEYKRIDPRDLYQGELGHFYRFTIVDRLPGYEYPAALDDWSGADRPIPVIVPRYAAVLPPYFAAKPIHHHVSQLWSDHGNRPA
jgi:hypothetical protein